MAITKQTKADHILEIKELISKSAIIVVWNYLGLKANDISDIRAKFRNKQSTNKIYKNRLAKIAFKESGKEEILEILEGPSSFLFIESDESNSLKILNDFIKEHEGKISFKAGYINDEYYDENSITEIASLPSKDELLSMLLSTLTGTMRNLAYAISQIATSEQTEKVIEETISTKEVEEQTIEKPEEVIE